MNTRQQMAFGGYSSPRPNGYTKKNQVLALWEHAEQLCLGKRDHSGKFPTKVMWTSVHI